MVSWVTPSALISRVSVSKAYPRPVAWLAERNPRTSLSVSPGVMSTPTKLAAAGACCCSWPSAVAVGPQPPQLTPKNSSTLGFPPGTLSCCPDIVAAVNETGAPAGPGPEALLAGVRAV